MSQTHSASDVLDVEFMLVRAKILEIAASLDRIDRAEGAVDGDRRREWIAQGIDVLAGHVEDRAEQIQLTFSREYNDDWREQFGVDTNR